MTPLAHRQFFPQEWEALLHYNGFEVERVEGDFHGGPLDARQRRDGLARAARRGRAMSIAERARASVRARIERAAAGGRAGPAGDVKLVAVSKTKPPEAIREAYAAGQRAFGENYAQELAAKAEALADLPDLEWHFIGHLQTNKAKRGREVRARRAHGRLGGARAGARQAARREDRAAPLPVLIEVNVGGEPQKAGATPSEIDEVIAAVRAQPSLALRGLMTVPPAGDLAAARASSRRSRSCATSTAAPRAPRAVDGNERRPRSGRRVRRDLRARGHAIFGAR